MGSTRGAVGGAEVNGDKVLSHEPGEADDSFAVGADGSVGLDLEGDFDLVALEADAFDAADVHAGHLDRVADLEFLDGVEEGGHAHAFADGAKPAHHLQGYKDG